MYIYIYMYINMIYVTFQFTRNPSDQLVWRDDMSIQPISQIGADIPVMFINYSANTFRSMLHHRP